MQLNEDQMDIITKADNLTGCYSSTTEETHWLNEEEAYSLIESFVEMLDTPLNEQINELYSKLNAQDKIINTQALEIARLKEQLENKIDLYEDTISYQLGFDKGKEYYQKEIEKLNNSLKAKIEKFKCREVDKVQQKIDKAIELLNELNIKLKDILKTGIDIKEIIDIKKVLEYKENEVEILETTLNTNNMNITGKKIEKINFDYYDYDDDEMFEKIKNKINEIIDYINGE